MNNYNNIPSLKQYVRTIKDKNFKELEEAGLNWAKAAAKNHLSYEIEWLGVPIIQTPEDMVLMQELIFKIQPDFIVETGIAHGGGLIYYASLLEILGKGKVIGVDIDIREHNRKVIENHPLFKKIELIQGSSIDPMIIQEIKKRIPRNSKVIVCLDSNHIKPHVLEELKAYQQFIISNCYIVVFDTVISELARAGIDPQEYLNNSPKEAVTEFLKNNDKFEIDKSFNKLYVSSAPNGYLKKIKL